VDPAAVSGVTCDCGACAVCGVRCVCDCVCVQESQCVYGMCVCGVVLND